MQSLRQLDQKADNPSGVTAKWAEKEILQRGFCPLGLQTSSGAERGDAASFPTKTDFKWKKLDKHSHEKIMSRLFPLQTYCASCATSLVRSTFFLIPEDQLAKKRKEERLSSSEKLHGLSPQSTSGFDVFKKSRAADPSGWSPHAPRPIGGMPRPMPWDSQQPTVML